MIYTKPVRPMRILQPPEPIHQYHFNTLTRGRSNCFIHPMGGDGADETMVFVNMVIPSFKKINMFKMFFVG